MTGGVVQYLAHFRVIRSYMREVSKADAEGHYIVDVAPLPDGRCNSSVSFAGLQGSRDT